MWRAFFEKTCRGAAIAAKLNAIGAVFHSMFGEAGCSDVNEKIFFRICLYAVASLEVKELFQPPQHPLKHSLNRAKCLGTILAAAGLNALHAVKYCTPGSPSLTFFACDLVLAWAIEFITPTFIEELFEERQALQL